VGYGTKTWANGNRYDGEWRDGDFNGRGIFLWANGDSYEGDWRDDMANGNGTLHRVESGQTFSGLWPNGGFNQGERRARIGATVEECSF